jgi:hypothetical protein
MKLTTNEIEQNLRLTPHIHVARVARQYEIGVLGVICSLVLSCCGIAFGMDGAGRVPAGLGSHSVLKGGRSSYSKGIEVSNCPKNEKTLGRSRVLPSARNSFTRPEHIPARNFVLGIHSERFDAPGILVTGAPNLYLLGGRLPVVLDHKWNTRAGERQAVDADVGPKLLAGSVRGDSDQFSSVSERKICDESGEYGSDRSHSFGSIFVVRKPFFYFTLLTSIFGTIWWRFVDTPNYLWTWARINTGGQFGNCYARRAFWYRIFSVALRILVWICIPGFLASFVVLCYTVARDLR